MDGYRVGIAVGVCCLRQQWWGFVGCQRPGYGMNDGGGE